MYEQQNTECSDNSDEHWSNECSNVVWTTEHWVFKWFLWYIDRLNSHIKSSMFNLAKKNFCYNTKIITVLQQWYQQAQF